MAWRSASSLPRWAHGTPSRAAVAASPSSGGRRLPHPLGCGRGPRLPDGTTTASLGSARRSGVRRRLRRLARRPSRSGTPSSRRDPRAGSGPVARRLGAGPPRAQARHRVPHPREGPLSIFMARALEWLDETLIPGFVSGFSRRGAIAGSGVHRATDPPASGAGYLDGPAPSLSVRVPRFHTPDSRYTPERRQSVSSPVCTSFVAYTTTKFSSLEDESTRRTTVGCVHRARAPDTRSGRRHANTATSGPFMTPCRRPGLGTPPWAFTPVSHRP